VPLALDLTDFVWSATQDYPRPLDIAEEPENPTEGLPEIEPEPETYMLVSRKMIYDAFKEWYVHTGQPEGDAEESALAQSSQYMRYLRGVWLSAAERDAARERLNELIAELERSNATTS
jgi:hypothetical protein